MEDDLVIDACSWHVSSEAAEYRQRALDHFRDRYTALLAFLRSEGLLADPKWALEVGDWLAFQLRRSNLTDEGYELVKLCHPNWNPSFGQGRTGRHLVQWRKKLALLRSPTGGG
jgi:hypothetical protein